MNLVNLQDTKLIYRSLLHFCALTMIYQERKLGNNTIYNHVKRNKIPRIKLRTKETNIWYHFWSEVKVSQSCLTLCDPMDCTIALSSQNTGVGSSSLLQEIFPTQGSNLCFICVLHWQESSLPLAPPGKPSSKVTVEEILSSYSPHSVPEWDI